MISFDRLESLCDEDSHGFPVGLAENGVGNLLVTFIQLLYDLTMKHDKLAEPYHFMGQHFRFGHSFKCIWVLTNIKFTPQDGIRWSCCDRRNIIVIITSNITSIIWQLSSLLSHRRCIDVASRQCHPLSHQRDGGIPSESVSRYPNGSPSAGTGFHRPPVNSRWSMLATNPPKPPKPMDFRYPLVNVYKKLWKKYHFQWVYQPFLWPFSIASCKRLRVSFLGETSNRTLAS